VIDDELAFLLVVFCPKASIWGTELCVVRVLDKVFDKEFAVGDGVGFQ
jgi:hypothetical protein